MKTIKETPTYKKMACSACEITSETTLSDLKNRQYCRECSGKGFNEFILIPKGCTGELPKCPVSFDPMVCGWECSKCNRSGPLEKAWKPTKKDEWVKI